MKKLINLLIIMILMMSISSCGMLKKTEKQESTQKIKWLQDKNCWCVPDAEMKLLLKEATLQK